MTDLTPELETVRASATMTLENVDAAPVRLWSGSFADALTLGPLGLLTALRESIQLLSLQRPEDGPLSAWLSDSGPLRKYFLPALFEFGRHVATPTDMSTELGDLLLETFVLLQYGSGRSTIHIGTNRQTVADTEDDPSEDFLLAVNHQRIRMQHNQRVSLNETIRRLRGSWLLFAEGGIVEELANSDPGYFLAEVAEVSERLQRVTFQVSLGDNQLQTLRQFFRT